MGVKAASKSTSLVLLFSILTIYSYSLISARQIVNRQLTDDEAQIRLGFFMEGPGFERSIKQGKESDYQLKPIHFHEKVNI